MCWQISCGKYNLDLSKPKIMGVLNITPDSFSDGGKFNNIDAACQQALIMQKQGADIIDIGGESSRPGAIPVSVEQELKRIMPTIIALQTELNIPISVDTCKPEVMLAAIKAGASMINDITALENPRSLTTVVQLNVPVCLMHMSGKPENMQQQANYQDVVAEILRYLEVRIKVAVAAGIKPNNIIIDPGFGFGKTLDHNLKLLKNLSQFTKFKLPILVGMSRKTMIGQMLNLRQPRLIGGLVVNTLAVQNGANIIRTHDVLATKQMLITLQTVAKS